MTARQLPPLILHPFADAGGPDKLVESSRASLVLQGLLPAGERNSQAVERTLLEGRFCEIRMLFYVGKDLLRWIDQCLELVNRSPDFAYSGIKYQSFAAYLVSRTPEPVHRSGPAQSLRTAAPCAARGSGRVAASEDAAVVFGSHFDSARADA